MIGRAIVWLGLAGILVFSATAHASSAWPVSKVNDNVCTADGPHSGDASMAIATFGSQTMLLITSDSFRKARGSYPVTLSFDDAPTLTFNAEGISATYGIPLSPALVTSLRSAAHMNASANGTAYEFPLQGIVAAIDNVRHCAGLPGYAETTSETPKDIPNSHGWKLVDSAPGSNDCSIRLNGSDVDTMIMLNNLGKPILIAGRNDWAMPVGPIKVTLKIGAGTAVEIDGNVMTNIVLVRLSDQQAAELKDATTLDWVLPWGKFEANISGVGVALGVLEACHIRKHPDEPH